MPSRSNFLYLIDMERWQDGSWNSYILKTLILKPSWLILIFQTWVLTVTKESVWISLYLNVSNWEAWADKVGSSILLTQLTGHWNVNKDDNVSTLLPPALTSDSWYPDIHRHYCLLTYNTNKFFARYQIIFDKLRFGKMTKTVVNCQW